MVLGRYRLVALLLVVTCLSAGCGGDNVKASDQPLDGSYKPAASLDAAVTSMMTALQSDDVNASFALLSPEARSEYRDVADWTERRRELAPVKSFEIQDGTDVTKTVLVRHDPGLDPFTGLTAAEERQTWTGEKFEDGWLLQAEPLVEAVRPADDQAPPAAKAWVDAVQACDQSKARALQGIETLFASVTPTICGVQGPVVVGNVEPLPEGPASANIVAQYTADSLQWARVVPVTSPLSLRVIMAPVGNEWKVIGLA